MRAIDDVLDRYGEDATLEDAVLVYEISYTDDDELVTELAANTTTHRASVTGGMAHAYAVSQLEQWKRTE